MERSRECNINGADLDTFTAHNTSSEMATPTFRSQPIGYRWCPRGTELGTNRPLFRNYAVLCDSWYAPDDPKVSSIRKQACMQQEIFRW